MNLSDEERQRRADRMRAVSKKRWRQWEMAKMADGDHGFGGLLPSGVEPAENMLPCDVEPPWDPPVGHVEPIDFDGEHWRASTLRHAARKPSVNIAEEAEPAVRDLLRAVELVPNLNPISFDVRRYFYLKDLYAKKKAAGLR